MTLKRSEILSSSTRVFAGADVVCLALEKCDNDRELRVADCQLSTPITLNWQSKTGNRQCGGRDRLVSCLLRVHVAGIATTATAILHVVFLHFMSLNVLHVLHVMVRHHVVGQFAIATFSIG